MTELKRYEMTIDYIGCGEYIADNEEFSNGDWCKAEEALALLAQKDARIAELEARIRELTEWRPISTVPNGLSLVAAKEGGWPFVLQRYMDGSWSAHWTDDELIGWLPLPEVTP